MDSDTVLILPCHAKIGKHFLIPYGLIQIFQHANDDRRLFLPQSDASPQSSRAFPRPPHPDDVDIFETSARRRRHRWRSRPAPPSGRSDRGEEIAECPGDVVGKLIDEEVPAIEVTAAELARLLEAEAKE